MLSKRWRAVTWIVVAVPLAVACGAARTRDAASRDAAGPRRRAAEPTAGPVVARAQFRQRDRQLTSLPAQATYAWVAPSAAFASVGRTDDEASYENTAGFRSTAMAVLSANGWRVADSASADYHLALVRVERTGERSVMTPDPRNSDPQPRKCDLSTTGVNSRCVEPPRPSYPPIISRQLYSQVSVGYAIVRARDGAARWWSLNQWADDEVDKFIAKSTLELLLAGAQP